MKRTAAWMLILLLPILTLAACDPLSLSAATLGVGDCFVEPDLGYFSPTSEGWGKGDRQMTCYLVPADGKAVSTSFKAAPAAS